MSLNSLNLRTHVDHVTLAPGNSLLSQLRQQLKLLRPLPVPTLNSETNKLSLNFNRIWLDAHNHWRSTYKVGALQWSEQLVNASKVLTSSCVWKHTENNKYGENMSAGQSSSKEVVDEWVTGPGEREAYSRGSNGYSHFTQVVWADTTAVGCSMTSCTDVAGSGLPQSPVKFWACEYNPAGNVIGQFDQNVKASTGGLPLA
ncbi:CAP domain-containing protein [Phakopsora pachyrhizi]|nr:CAP domain-containing protein [Phakopsora pachyrhizi]